MRFSRPRGQILRFVDQRIGLLLKLGGEPCHAIFHLMIQALQNLVAALLTLQNARVELAIQLGEARGSGRARGVGWCGCAHPRPPQ